ncbi:hypothetical protein B296_00002449 [Ensete ventricosum]|uniref:Uncharacterized protein n=1 Tax=Ensete ventricosum TaxID=4639 RepID=A0A426YP63_ENSVE|nr:hypothetical protein B296_00002449 [Ensete ventricosum]
MVAGLQRLRIGRSREMATTVTVEQDGSDGLKQRWQRCKEARSCLSGMKTRWHRWTRRGPGTTVLDPQAREEVIFFVDEEEMKLVQLQAADEALICHGCDLIDATLEAFETRMEDKLRALFVGFKLGRSLSPMRSQHGESSDRKENPPEKEEQATELSYQRMRVDFLDGKTETRWDGFRAWSDTSEERLNQEDRRTKVIARLVALRLSTPSSTSRPPQPKKLSRELRDRSAKGLC